MFSFLPLLPIFILYVLSELLGSNYFLKKISIHVWGSECSPMDDIRTSPKPLFYRLSLAWPEPILLAGFVLYTVSTSPFLMLTPNLPLSIILFCFFLLKWPHPLPEYFWAFSPLKVSWPLCFWPSWAFCERSLREWGYGSRELTVALWGQNLRDHNWFSQGDQMASPAASLASRSREVSYLLTMPPWASFPVWVSLSTSVKWAWWTYFTVLLWGSHEMPALTLFLAPKRCSVHDSFLPSLTKDLFCAHTWAAPCFEGGQRWGPVLRKLSCWETIATLFGTTMRLSEAVDGAENASIPAWSPAQAWFCLRMGGGSTWALTSVELVLPVSRGPYILGLLFLFDSRIATFESWTLSAEEHVIPSSGDRCWCGHWDYTG